MKSGRWKSNPVAVYIKELLQVKQGKKKVRKVKISREPHVIKEINISWPRGRFPVDFGPRTSSSKRLHSIARRDDPLASMDMDQLET